MVATYNNTSYKWVMQKKSHSFIEVCLNTAIGYAVAVLSQYIVFPYFHIYTSIESNLKIGAIFTIVSIVRSYFVRRLFNWWGSRELKKIQKENNIKDRVEKLASAWKIIKLIRLINENR